MEFVEFPKMARLSREVIVTEKIDGTNAAVVIYPTCRPDMGAIATVGGFDLFAQSRTRFITPSDDNFGFARWVVEHAEELIRLGTGRHFGEWFGSGIQRNYGLSDKRFALFNTSRWSDPAERPGCTTVAPVLYQGNFSDLDVRYVMNELQTNGSVIVRGFMKPEGIVIYHVAAGIGFKKTLEKDELPKTLAKAA